MDIIALTLANKYTDTKIEEVSPSNPSIADIQGLQTILNGKSNIFDLNFGRAIYVNSENGHDNNNGLTPSTSFATIKAAIENTNGDIALFLQNQTHIISGRIDVRNRKVGFYQGTIKKSGAHSIICSNATIGMGLVEVEFENNFFQVVGHAHFILGGYYSAVFRPLSNVNCNIIVVGNITPYEVLSGAGLVSISSNRLHAITDNMPTYNSIYNIVGYDSNYQPPIILIKFYNSLKSVNVKWVQGTDDITVIGKGNLYVY